MADPADDPADEKSERSDKNYMTPGGYRRLADELVHLAGVERPKVCREVSDAAAEGDRSENAAYIYGKKRLREIDRRMGFLQRRLDTATVVGPENAQPGRVFFGATVEVEDDQGETHAYRIVGVDEVEAERGRISWRSPTGRALLGKRVDDAVTVRWHAGERELTVVKVSYEAEAPVVVAAKGKPAKTKPAKEKAAKKKPVVKKR